MSTNMGAYYALQGLGLRSPEVRVAGVFAKAAPSWGKITDPPIIFSIGGSDRRLGSTAHDWLGGLDSPVARLQHVLQEAIGQRPEAPVIIFAMRFTS